MHIDIIAGARPNLMKIAPILEALEAAQNAGWPLEYRLIHTGQHTGERMNDIFFRQLGIPEPHITLEAGGGMYAQQAAAILAGYEKVLLDQKPHLLIVVGDVTSTMACALAAKKVGGVKIAHVEAGLQCGDLFMPEENNRIITDSVSDYFFTTSETAGENLRKSGVPESRIFFVGNTMIDTLLKHQPRFEPPPVWDKLDLSPGAYFVLTLHRPVNVDDVAQLSKLVATVADAARGLPVIFPVHPRTALGMNAIGGKISNLHRVQPLGYLQFNYLVQHAKAVVTDSGGVSEETTILNVPCFTLRDRTERPETCTMGTNRVVADSPEAIRAAFEAVWNEEWPEGTPPPRWDGRAAVRIVAHLIAVFKLEQKAVLKHA